jgi:hypothetical protein
VIFTFDGKLPFPPVKLFDSDCRRMGHYTRSSAKPSGGRLPEKKELPAQPKVKKAYQKPHFQYERVFENYGVSVF